MSDALRRRFFVLLVVVTVPTLAACGIHRQHTEGSAPPVAGASPSEVAPDAVNGCPAPAQPGPADAPPDGGGDGMDFTGHGAARWRLCLTRPTVATVENRGSCLWSEDRASVLEVFGHPARIGAIDYDAWIAFEQSQFQLSATDRARGGLIATYLPGANQPFGEAPDNRQVGQIAFEVSLMNDPEAGPPEGAPPRQVGWMRWICGDPPPPA